MNKNTARHWTLSLATPSQPTHLRGELPQYMAAAKMAAETYGMNLPPDPVFIRWNDTPEENQAWYWRLGAHRKRNLVRSKNLMTCVHVGCFAGEFVCFLVNCVMCYKLNSKLGLKASQLRLLRASQRSKSQDLNWGEEFSEHTGLVHWFVVQM